MDVASPEFHALLGQWLVRQRLEESIESRKILENSQTMKTLEMLRNPVVNNQFAENLEILHAFRAHPGTDDNVERTLHVNLVRQAKHVAEAALREQIMLVTRKVHECKLNEDGEEVPNCESESSGDIDQSE